MFVNSKKFTEYQIFSSETGANTKHYLSDITELQSHLSLSNNQDTVRLRILEDEKNHINTESYNQNLVDKFFYVVLKHEDQETLQRMRSDALYIFKQTFSAYELDFHDFIKTIYRYFNPFRSQYETTNIEDIFDITPLDFLSPSEIELSKKGMSQYIRIDKVYCKTYHIYSYPQYPIFAWLSYLTSFKGIDFSCHIHDCDNSRLIKDYDRQYNALVKNYNKTKKESEREVIKSDMESVQLMIQSLSKGVKKSISFLTTLRLQADTLEELENLENFLMAETSGIDILLRQGFFDQKKLFLSTAPLCNNQAPEYEKDVVCNVLAWGFPYVFESLNDIGLPILIGKSKSTGGAIFYNHLYKDKSRTNSNEIMFGTTGSGKTYFLMHLIYHRYARGHKQIIIDLEGKQMNKLTAHLGGEVINCATGGGGIINPLQIRITIDDDLEGNKRSLDEIYPLASHIQFLRTFFGMYFHGLSRIMLSEIEDAIEELYKDWGFTFQTAASELQHLKPSDFPIMSDLLEVMEKRLQAVDQENKEKLNRVEIVRNFVKRLALGADSVLFNGTTNIDLSNDLLCLVLAGLQDKDTTILRTQYYNILSFIQTEIISGKFQNWIQIYADEFHLLMNKEIPDIMMFLRQLIKIIRKYNGGLTTSTQSISDVLHEDVALYGGAIIGNSNYKFYFKQDTESVQYLKEHKIVSDTDADFLRYAEIGQAYMDLGANALQIEVTIPDEIKTLFDSFISNENRF